MANEFVNAKIAIMAVVAGVSGIAQAPTNPNDTQNVYPFVAGYLSTANVGGGAIGTNKALYNISLDLLTKMNDLASDLALLDPFIDSIPAALEVEITTGDRFGATISTFDSITIQFIPGVEYDGVPCRGYRFILNNVKILSNT